MQGMYCLFSHVDGEAAKMMKHWCRAFGTVPHTSNYLGQLLGSFMGLNHVFSGSASAISDD